MTAERVFLTGGTGFVGSHLRARLAEEGRDVTLLVRPGTEVETRAGESVCRGTLSDLDGLDPGAQDAVVHLAAVTSVEAAVEDPARAWAVNATGTLAVYELARELDADRVLYASTASVYGPPEFLPVTEAHPTNPVEPYGASKLAGDRLGYAYHRTYDLPVVVARLFNSYGPGQSDRHVVSTILRQALAGETVELGNLSPSRDFLYVKDSARALARLLDAGVPGEAYNVASGEAVEIGDLARRAVEVVGADVDVVSVAERRRDDSIEIPRMAGDGGKLRALGWEPTYALAAGLSETAAALDAA